MKEEIIESEGISRGQEMSKVIGENSLPRLAKALENLRTLKLTIFHLPYRELSPNSCVHWAVKARVARAQREETGWLAKIEWQPLMPMKHATISYTFVVKDKRHRDLDNLISACKSFQDGLIDAGVLESDNSQHLTLVQCNVMQGEAEQTIITLNEVK